MTRRLLLVGVLLLAGAGAESLPQYRRAEWPHWLAAPGYATSCRTVREQVLIDEARRVIVTADGCTILRGEWLDVYTGELLTMPSAIDVDHMLPLRWTHDHGGWRWSRHRKRAYANDLSDADHLIAVSARANRAKGDRGPDRWVPPRRQAHCAYGRAWDRLTARWGLQLHAPERRAIRALLTTCPTPDFCFLLRLGHRTGNRISAPYSPDLDPPKL